MKLKSTALVDRMIFFGPSKGAADNKAHRHFAPIFFIFAPCQELQRISTGFHRGGREPEKSDSI